MTLLSDLVDWLVKEFGVVRVENAASYAELDNDLTALGIPAEDRPEVLNIARLIAQAGVSGEVAAKALTSGAVEATFGMMREVERLDIVTDRLRKIVAETPDIREPDTWWPLSQDSEEFKRGARWVENWWRIQISKALEGKS